MFRILGVAAVLAALVATPVYAQQAVGQPVGAQQFGAKVGVPGGDADVHGCAPSTGYTWSVLRKSCIQIWTAGIPLDPVKPQGSAVMAAFIVFASWYDHHRVEVFMPSVQGSVMLQKSNGAWHGAGYGLTRQNGVYTLSSDQAGPIYAEAPAAPK